MFMRANALEAVGSGGRRHAGTSCYAGRHGRFMQPDPLGYQAATNLYVYVSGDPVNATDPSGTEECTGSHFNFPGGCAGGIAPWLSGSSTIGFGKPGGSSGGKDASNNPGKGDFKNVQQPMMGSTPGFLLAAGPMIPGPWTADEFMAHYFIGNGETLDLRDMGLGKLYENAPSVRDITSSFMTSIMSNPARDFWVPNKEIGHTDVTETIFSLGKSAFSAAGGCRSADCFFRFSINDSYEDPLELGMEIPFGAPYRIVYEWSVQAKRGGW